MKKFFTHGLIFILGGFVILHSLANTVKIFAPDGSSYFLQIDEQHVKSLLENNQEVEAIVLGNSHGDNIVFDAVNYNGYQLSRAWGDFFEIKYYLEYLVPRLPNLEAVILPVSYFSFYWDNSAADILKVRRTQMYQVIPTWGFIQGDLLTFINGRGTQVFPVTTILREDNWKGVFVSILAPEVNQVEPISQTDGCDHPTLDNLIAHAQVRAADQINLSSEIKENHKGLQDDTYNTVVGIVEYLQSKGIRIIFFTPPYFTEYTNVYLSKDPEAIALMRQNMAALQKQYGVEYYDFATDNTFISSYKLFKDSDHLNACGKKLFSEKFNLFITSQISP